MKILIIGGGGREHAIGWKLHQDKKVKKIYFAPGNGGTGEFGENIDIKASEIDALLRFAIRNKIDLTIVGPEDPLALGIVDLFKKNKLLIFGPTKLAARLESSKAWTADFMEKYKIPHPLSFRFKNYHHACSFFKSHKATDFVIKASGLALGKGVILPESKNEALGTIKRMMIDKEFGEAGTEIILQERLHGEEISVLALTDGKTVLPLLPAQDHKRVFDQDRGPNTGGMGAYAPVPLVTKKLMNTIVKTIIQPTVDGMRKEGYPYQGVLYAGLMITQQEPKVLEFNVRFGDPETQPIMMLLKSDLVKIMFACIQGTLHKQKISFRGGSSVCVVLAAGGYPGHYEKGEIIHGLENYETDIKIFHAGTCRNSKQIISSGGRVLGVTTYGKTINVALKKAYSTIGKNKIYFNKMHYRKDIGRKSRR